MKFNSITKVIKRIFKKKELIDPCRNWAISAYMKTPDVCAMDIRSFLNSKEVKEQCAAADKILKYSDNPMFGDLMSDKILNMPEQERKTYLYGDWSV